MADQTRPAEGLPPELFSQATKTFAPVTGDKEREAVDSLRGYAYQIAVTAVAWLSLGDDEKLFLEVAEDYAVCAGDGLNAVQVKDTNKSGSITLNSDSVRKAISSYIHLAELNPHHRVSVHYLTTSDVGLERRMDDRPRGLPGLVYWRRAAAGADVSPLRNLLAANDVPADISRFVEARNDSELRSELLQRIHWDTNQADLDGIRQTLDQKVASVAKKEFQVPITESKRLSNILLFAVLERAVRPSAAERELSRRDLIDILDEATRISISRPTFERLTSLQQAVPPTGGQLQFSSQEGWLFRDEELVAQALSIPRTEVESPIRAQMLVEGKVLIIGATGLGKTMMARAVLSPIASRFVVADFRDLEVDASSQRLDILSRLISQLDARAIILDDLNHLENERVGRSLARLLSVLANNDRLAVITSYRKPSTGVLSKIGVTAADVFEIPYFSTQEVSELVAKAGANPEQWAEIAYLTAASGHPQLVNAFIVGMATNGWRKEEIEKLLHAGFVSTDVEDLRDEARQRILSELSDDCRTLLFRTSLLIGAFDRQIAIALGSVKPKLQQPGVQLDTLIGPWIETVGRDKYRLSPMAAKSGAKSLTPEETIECHQQIASLFVRKGTISAADADQILMHGLLGKNVSVLLVIAHATMSASDEILSQLAEYSFLFPSLQTSKPVFPDDLNVSVMLRLAQIKVLSKKDSMRGIAKCVEAASAELSQLSGILRDGMEGMFLLTTLSISGIAAHLPNWGSLLVRLRAVNSSKSQFAEVLQATPLPEGIGAKGIVGALFISGLFGLQTVRDLEMIFERLYELTSSERDSILSQIDGGGFDFDAIVSGAWLHESISGTLAWMDARDRYTRLAELTRDWGYPSLAAYFCKSAAVMIDEYGGDSTAALTYLDDQSEKLGSADALVREKIKVIWRRNEHAHVVELLKPIVHDIMKSHPLERMFVLREGAISAANSGDHRLAADWFKLARDALSSNDQFLSTSIGLLADEAVEASQCGEATRSIRLFADALDSLPKLSADNSLKSVYCKNIIPHAVMYVQMESEPWALWKSNDNHRWLPGLGSNPDPVEAIREKQLASLTYGWYILAEAAIMMNADAQTIQYIHANIERYPIAIVEVGLAKTTVVASVLRSNPVAFALSLKRFAECMIYLQNNSTFEKENFDPVNPRTVRIPVLTIAELVQSEITSNLVQDCIFAFAVTSAFARSHEKFIALGLELIGNFGSDYPAKSFYMSLLENRQALDPLYKSVADVIAQLGHQDDLSPTQSYMCCLRIFQACQGSNFKRELHFIIENWMRARWSLIMENQRFLLHHPMANLPPIEEVLSIPDLHGGQFIAQLLLASADAVKVRLSGEYSAALNALTREAH